MWSIHKANDNELQSIKSVAVVSSKSGDKSKDVKIVKTSPHELNQDDDLDKRTNSWNLL